MPDDTPSGHPDGSVPDCVADLMAKGHDESSAYAICKANLQGQADEVEVASLEDLGVDAEHMDELADASAWDAHDGVWAHEAEALVVYDESLAPQGDLPAECRECGSADRMAGVMVCADCAGDAEEQAAPADEPGEGHIFGPYTNGTSLRLEAGEAYCEEAGEVFDQFDDANHDDADRRLCPYCGTQLQAYDKHHNVASHTGKQLVVAGDHVSQEMAEAIARRYNVGVSVVDGEGGAAPTDHESPDE